MIAVIEILAGLLLPVLARSKSRAATVGYSNNLWQLLVDWTMYADGKGVEPSPSAF